MPASVVDLHMHSTASDGSLAPADVVALAQRNGVKIIALTDHDSVAGLPAALERAREAGIRIIPGIELSVSEQNMDVHLLAYGFDTTDARMLEAIARYRESRHDRARKILTRLKGLGIRIPMEEVEEIAPEPGEPFDPTRHQALMQQESKKHKPGSVVQTLQKGYALHGRTLRPAQVAVAKGA